MNKVRAYFLFFIGLFWFVICLGAAFYIAPANSGPEAWTMWFFWIPLTVIPCLVAWYGGYRSLQKPKVILWAQKDAPVEQPRPAPVVDSYETTVGEKGMGLIKVYVILFRRSISQQEYGDRVRKVLGYEANATIVGVPSTDETFAQRAITEVCGNIGSMAPVPEVVIEKDDLTHFRNEPIPGGGMNEYAINFLKRKVAEGKDPDYFNIQGYQVYVTTSADRITGDGALIIRICR